MSSKSERECEKEYLKCVKSIRKFKLNARNTFQVIKTVSSSSIKSLWGRYCTVDKGRARTSGQKN